MCFEAKGWVTVGKLFKLGFLSLCLKSVVLHLPEGPAIVTSLNLTSE